MRPMSFWCIECWLRSRWERTCGWVVKRFAMKELLRESSNWRHLCSFDSHPNNMRWNWYHMATIPQKLFNEQICSWKYDGASFVFHWKYQTRPRTFQSSKRTFPFLRKTDVVAIIKLCKFTFRLLSYRFASLPFLKILQKTLMHKMLKSDNPSAQSQFSHLIENTITFTLQKPQWCWRSSMDTFHLSLSTLLAIYFHIKLNIPG